VQSEDRRGASVWVLWVVGCAVGVVGMCLMWIWGSGDSFEGNREVEERGDSFEGNREEEERGSAYENFGSLMLSSANNTSLVSSSAMMSARWYSSASLSFERWETRSVMSNVREVKPSVSRYTSWLSGTWRMVLWQEVSLSGRKLLSL